MWPTPCGTDTMGPVFIREAAHCVFGQFGFVFLRGPACGSLPFASGSNSPGGRPWAARPPRPPRGPAGRPLALGEPASFPRSGQWHACASHGQGLAAVPVADSTDLRSQPRMQADKCRMSCRSVRKELVIESPLQRKDAAAGEAEAESPGPVLVRGLGRRVSAVFSARCFSWGCAPSAFWRPGFQTCSARLLANFPSADSLWFHFSLGGKDTLTFSG